MSRLRLVSRSRLVSTTTTLRPKALSTARRESCLEPVGYVETLRAPRAGHRMSQLHFCANNLAHSGVEEALDSASHMLSALVRGPFPICRANERGRE